MPLFKSALLDLSHHHIDASLRLKGESFLEERLEETDKGVLDMELDVSELLITLILKDLSEESNIVILSEIPLGSIADSSHPLNDQTLEPVSLVKVGVHELFHGLSGKLRFLTLLVILHLLLVNVIDDVLQLLQGQLSSMGLSHWP